MNKLMIEFSTIDSDIWQEFPSYGIVISHLYMKFISFAWELQLSQNNQPLVSLGFLLLECTNNNFNLLPLNSCLEDVQF